MKLNYKSYGKGKAIVILHGLLGSLDNWATHAKNLSELGYQVITVDQRNHGKSPHDVHFDYDNMTEDLEELYADLGLSDTILIGHSMGGKTAMNFACLYANLVEKLIIVDIAPKYYPPHHEKIFAGLNAIKPAMLQSRQEADLILKEHIEEPGVRQFLLKNLMRTSEGFSWKMNLKDIESNIENIGEALNHLALFNNPTLFVDGANSNYILEEDHELIEQHFPEAQIVSISGAGHWVHAEAPAAFFNHVKSFLDA